MKHTELRWVGALLATGALSGCRSETLTPSAPTSRPGMRQIPELPSMPASIVDAPIRYALEETRAKVEGALNRDLTSGVQLSGTVRTGKLLDVLVHPRWLVVRAEAAGTLALDVDRASTVRRTVRVGR